MTILKHDFFSALCAFDCAVDHVHAVIIVTAVGFGRPPLLKGGEHFLEAAGMAGVPELGLWQDKFVALADEPVRARLARSAEDRPHAGEAVSIVR